MQIANIWPIKNQQLYSHESTVMLLAHLLAKGLYDSSNFNDKQYIILDNGAAEFSMVSNQLEDLIQLAEHSNIPVKEIIIPDVLKNQKETIKLFEQNIDTIKKWQHKYNFMIVMHAQTDAEVRNIFNYINQYKDLHLTLGIPRLLHCERFNSIMIEMYSKATFPIHFLGVKKSFQELLPVYRYIRSCDTAQIAYIADTVKEIPTSVFTYVKSGKGVDLETVDCDTDLLNTLRIKLEMEMHYNGIL